MQSCGNPDKTGGEREGVTSSKLAPGRQADLNLFHKQTEMHSHLEEELPME